MKRSEFWEVVHRPFASFGLAMIAVVVAARWATVYPVQTSDFVGPSEGASDLAPPIWSADGERDETAPGCTIGGVVTDTISGQPVSGVAVSVTADAPEDCTADDCAQRGLGLATGASGRVTLGESTRTSLTGLDGRWSIGIPNWSGVSIGFAVMGRLPRAVRSLSPCASGSFGSLHVAMSRGGGRLTGIVQNSKGQPVVDALVVFRTATKGTAQDDNLAVYVAKTDSYGVFWTNLAPGEYLGFPEHPRYARSGPRRYRIGNGLNRIEMALLPAGSLHGQVVGESGETVGGVVVEAYLDRRAPSLAMGEWFATARADAAGRFVLRRIPPLPIVVTASSATGIAVTSYSMPSPAPDFQNHLTLRLRTSAGLDGIAVSEVNSAQNPVSDLQLFARAVGTGFQYRATSPTDVDGRFQFPFLPDGEYELFAGAEGSDFRSLAETLHVSESNRHDVIVRWSPPLLPQRSVTSARRVSLAGVVQDSVGNPVPNLSVVLAPTDLTSNGDGDAGPSDTVGSGSVLVSTAADGSYFAQDLAPGRYLLSAFDAAGERLLAASQAPNRLNRLLPIDVTAQMASRNLNIEVEECRNRIFGVVTDGTGRPLAHATIRARRLERSHTETKSGWQLAQERPLAFDTMSDAVATSNELGRYALLGLCEGEYRLSGVSSNLQLVGQRAPVRTNELAQLTLQQKSTLSLRVIATTRAVKDFQMALIELSTGHRVTRNVRAEGDIVSLSNLTPGAYWTQIVAPEGYVDRRFELVPGQELPAIVDLEPYGVVRGRLLSPSGLAIRGATVRVTDELQFEAPDGSVRRTTRILAVTTTNEGGAFELERVQAHRGRLTFTAADGAILMLVDAPTDHDGSAVTHHPYRIIEPKHSEVLDLGELHAVLFGQTR